MHARKPDQIKEVYFYDFSIKFQTQVYETFMQVYEKRIQKEF